MYKDNVLQYILNEEGRARPVANDSTQGYTRFVYDHFIKDHLGNVRSTVTANPITLGYLARHEIATASVEQLVFDNIPNVRDAKPGSINPNDGMAAHLDANGADTRVGTAIMLKVMPGDKFTISASTYHQGQYGGGEETGSNALVESLMSALMGGSTYAGVPVSDLPENIRIVKDILENPALPGQLAALQSDDVSTAPKAHLNYLFFNEQMELQPELSGSVQVSPSSNLGWELLNPSNICNCTMSPTGPNGGVTGYVLVYVDNQSLGKSVWFDDVHIEHFTSSVLEENHYYPHGLTVGINQSVQGNLPGQPIKFQGQRHDNDLGVNIYSFKYREHDPQIGRFWQVDPLSEKFTHNSTYAFSENKVTSHFELEGLEAVKLSDGNTLHGPWNSNLYTGKWGQKLGIPQFIRNRLGRIPNTPAGEGRLIREIVKTYQLDKIYDNVVQTNENGDVLTGEIGADYEIENGNSYYYHSSIAYDAAMDAAVLVQAHEYMHIGQQEKLNLKGDDYNSIKREFFANFFNLYPNSISKFKGDFFPKDFKSKYLWPVDNSERHRNGWRNKVEEYYNGLTDSDKKIYKDLIDKVRNDVDKK